MVHDLNLLMRELICKGAACASVLPRGNSITCVHQVGYIKEQSKKYLKFSIFDYRN